MKIAPIDIAHKSFSKKMFGVDSQEVTDFLRDIADQLEQIVRERNKLKEDLREKEMQILEFRDRDKILRDTVTTAQRMSEKMREDAEREAKMIINDANQKAEMIVRDARDSLKRVYQEITDIKRSRLQFENNLKALLNSHLKMLESHDDLLQGIQFREPDETKKITSEKDPSISPVSR